MPLKYLQNAFNYIFFVYLLIAHQVLCKPLNRVLAKVPKKKHKSNLREDDAKKLFSKRRNVNFSYT